jgi:hypothetical protein
MIMIEGRTSELHELSNQQRDTLRLLQARLTETPAVPCTSPAHYQLHIDTASKGSGSKGSGSKGSGPAVAGPDCGFPQRQPEIRALTVLLENAFGV